MGKDRLVQAACHTSGENASYARVVKTVACFDLGPLWDEANFLQYVIAATIRDTLSEDSKHPNMNVVAQSENLCEICKSTLSDILGIKVLENHRVLIGVNKETLTIVGGRHTGIIQAIISLTLGVEGPAAIMCCPITDDGSVSDSAHGDYSTPLAWKWIQQCEYHEEFCELLADNNGKALRLFHEAGCMKLYWGARYGMNLNEG